MVMTFAVLLGIIFVLEIAAGITAYAMQGQVEDFLQDELKKNMKDFSYDAEHANAVTDAWNEAQRNFMCCGVNNYTEWKTAENPSNVPDSCCFKNQTTILDCGHDQLTSPTHIYTNGCLQEFMDWVKDNIIIIGGVGIGLAFVQIVGIIIACCLARTIHKEYQVV